MNRIRQKFDELSAQGKQALIPYITPEFPFRGITVPLLSELENAGADLIEIGVPFSDPLADGETIQFSSAVALKNGVSFPLILQAVREFRKSSGLPLLLMGYMNPILKYGLEQFIADAHVEGVDGLIVPDLPPEEAGQLKSASEQFGLSNVFLIAPTTGEERIRYIDELSTDFSYCVSVTGVTGARSELGKNGSMDQFLERVRKHTKKRFVVGFGISKPEHVRHVWRFADGAVVGSALIQVMKDKTSQNDAVRAAAAFLQSLHRL